MRLSGRILFTVAALLLALFLTPSAQAVLANRVFMSTNGNNAHNCANPLTPCLTFAGALAQVAVGGEVIAETTGGYGPLNITQSVSINAAPGVVAYTGSQVNVNAPGATVVLRGLTIDGTGTTTGSGINVIAVAALHVESCVIRGFAGVLNPDGNGIYFTSAGQLFLKDTILRGNNIGVELYAGNGILNAVVEHCRAENNFDHGFEMAGNGHTTIRDTVSSGNGGEGFMIYAPTSTLDVTLENCTASNNAFDGVAIVYGGTVRVSNCTITDNAGYGFDNFSGAGIFLSRQNNTVEGNVKGQTSGTIASFTSR